MKATLASFWNWLTKSRYVVFLESEVSRLQKDNRELVNALLSANHLPMLPREESQVAPPRMRQKLLPSQYRERLERFTAQKHEEGEKHA